jgi:hypothetical protein
MVIEFAAASGARDASIFDIKRGFRSVLLSVIDILTPSENTIMVNHGSKMAQPRTSLTPVCI